MKYYILLLMLFSIPVLHAQAFNGSADSKFQVGANLQSNGSGLHVSYDYGIGDNISLGVSSNYLLGISLDDFNFEDRIDLRARFNANIGNVLAIDDNFDVYPGLSFGLRNFGGHLGFRYFLTDGFGVYSEFNIPISSYESGDLSDTQQLNNQFTISIGASFNL